MTNECYNTPVGSVTDLIMITLGASSRLETVKPISHSAEYKLCKSSSNPKHQSLMKKKDNYEIIIDLPDIDTISKNCAPAKKMFVWLLIKANEQAIFGREIQCNAITFHLSDLVDNGMYSKCQSARTGFKSAMNALTSVKIKGQIRGYRPSKIEALEVLFTGYAIKNSICTIYLNDRIDWSFVFQRFTKLPRVYFSLSKRASDLFYYIYSLVQYKQTDIEKNGCFTIGLRTIQRRLMLPDENAGRSNPHLTRDIKEEIKRVVKEIASRANNIELTLVSDNSQNIREYLDGGCLKIRLIN